MTSVKSINLYTRPAKIQKERYDKLQERTQSTKLVVPPTAERQLELFLEEAYNPPKK